MVNLHYLTQERPGSKGEGKVFKSVNEAILAYENQVITADEDFYLRREEKRLTELF